MRGRLTKNGTFRRRVMEEVEEEDEEEEDEEEDDVVVTVYCDVVIRSLNMCFPEQNMSIPS